MRLIQGECLTEMEKLINDGVKVDMVFADLPYGETDNEWDKIIDLEYMFELLKEITYDYAPMVFTGSFRFGVRLFNACPELYKYDWIWVKNNLSNLPLVNHCLARYHECVYIYGKGGISSNSKTHLTYNPQKTKDEPYVKKQGSAPTNFNGGMNKGYITVNDGWRYPKTIQYFKKEGGYHPTQKPVLLMEWIVKTYSNKGDTVLDFTMGSGTTGVACLNTNRDFIGIELDKDYYNIAVERCREYQSTLI